jgi:hypothetical protein
MAFAAQKFGSFALGSGSAAKLLRSKSQAGLEQELPAGSTASILWAL